MIQPIVEGHGEVPAVPVLLRKLGELMQIPYVPVASPIRQKRSQLTQEAGLKRAVQMARAQPGCKAILVMFDADDDCPKEVAPKFLTWAQEAAAPLPCSVVIPNREYEGWFLAGLESLLEQRGIQPAVPYNQNPEAKRDAKGELEDRLGGGFRYFEKTDQPSFTALADWSLIHGRSRSFRKMVKETRRLFHASGLQPSAWPN
jgi:hypothetical protein